MRTFFAFLSAVAVFPMALIASPILLLVPTQTFITPNARVECEVYLYNDSKKAVMVPSFETISKVYGLRDMKGIRLPRGASSTSIASHPPGEHSLGPGRVERTRIIVEIPAASGDLVDLYIEIGSKSVLRSNSVLLFCPAEEKAMEPASSPKSAITPQKN
jgi:hypothetical protein